MRLGRSWSKTLFEGYRPVPVESPVELPMELPVDALLLEQPAVVAEQGQAAVELLQAAVQGQAAVQVAGQGKAVQ